MFKLLIGLGELEEDRMELSSPALISAFCDWTHRQDSSSKRQDDYLTLDQSLAASGHENEFCVLSFAELEEFDCQRYAAKAKAAGRPSKLAYR